MRRRAGLGWMGRRRELRGLVGRGVGDRRHFHSTRVRENLGDEPLPIGTVSCGAETEHDG